MTLTMCKIALVVACLACMLVQTATKRLQNSHVLENPKGAQAAPRSLTPLEILVQSLNAASAFNPSIPASRLRVGSQTVTRMSESAVAKEEKDMSPTELQAVIEDLKSERDTKDAIIVEKEKMIESMKEPIPVEANSESIEDNEIFVDVEAKLAEANFKIPPAELIHLAKRFLASANGFGADADLLSEDFKFVAPVVGPLSKDAFLGAIGSVDIKAGFPDFLGEFYGFHVDPFEGNRVWYTARGRGTNTGPLPPFAPTPTGKTVINPPQACSVTFNEEGLVTKYTIGYVMDREVGNTGGLGGLYGVLYAIGRGLPFPEAQPWQISPQYALFQSLGNLASKVLGR